ncbi:MAG: alpha/beta hydrolase [Pseudomonadota bacterium]
MIDFEVRGPDNGTPVVFLHAVGVDSWMWTKVLEHLGEIRAILVDLPGHGRSNTCPWVSLEHSAALVCEVVNEHCPDGAHLAALSLGSYVGLLAMVQQPTLFRSAILSGIHAGNMPRKLLMYMMSAALAPLATRPFMAKKTAAVFGVETDETESFVKSATRTTTSAFRRATNDVVAFEMPASVAQIQTPVLFAAGADEHELILSALKRFEHALPLGSSTTIPDGGHGWPAKNPDAFAALLRENIVATGCAV